MLPILYAQAKQLGPKTLVRFGQFPPSVSFLLLSTFLNNPDLSLSTVLYQGLRFRGKHPPKLQGNALLRTIRLLATQLKSSYSLGLASCPPLDRTITHEENVYFMFDSLLGLTSILTDLMTPQRCCGITECFLGFCLISNTLARAGEERVFNLIDQLRNELLLRLNGRVDFPPQDGQALESDNVIVETSINAKFRRPQFIRVELPKRINFGLRLVSDFQPK